MKCFGKWTRKREGWNDFVQAWSEKYGWKRFGRSSSWNSHWTSYPKSWAISQGPKVPNWERPSARIGRNSRVKMIHTTVKDEKGGTGMAGF